MNAKRTPKILNSMILILIAVMSLVIRLLNEYNFDQSALLYVGVPFLVALALLWIDRPDSQGSWKKELLNHTLLALVVMLGSSVILFEGFLCVVMFMPIYFGVILLTFVYRYSVERYQLRKKGRLYSHIIPVLIVFGALEGSHPSLSMPREEQVSVTEVVNLNISEIKANLTKMNDLKKDRQWFLALFPMPHRVDAKSMKVGEIHTLDFRYHRWFVTNTHSGSMQMQVQRNDEQVVVSKFIKDTSYIANYLQLNQSMLNFEPVNDNQTKVTITISYTRLLDPAWYFGPLQQYGLTKTAEFLLKEVISHEDD